MTLVSDIITKGLLETGVLGLGTIPGPEETTVAQGLLKDIFLSVLGTDVGEPFSSISIGMNNVKSPDYFSYTWPQSPMYTIPPNTRLVTNLTSSRSVLLGPNPQNGSRFSVVDVSDNLSTFPLTVEGNGRLIEGSPSYTINEDGFKGEWFYRADLGVWKRVTPILLSDEMPFPEEHDTFFIISLAKRLAPIYSTSLSAESLAALQKATTTLKAEYSQKIQVPSEFALLRTNSVQRYQTYSGFSDQYQFNYGYPFWGRY